MDNEQVAFAFWINSSDTLPDVCRDGLLSAAKVARFKVFLLGYQSFTNLPDGVEFVNASQYLEDLSYLSRCKKQKLALADCSTRVGHSP